MCLQRGSPPPCPVRQAPCSSRTLNSPLFLFSSTSRQMPHAARLAGIPMGCPPPLHTHMPVHTRSHILLSLQSLPTFPDALVSQLASTCSYILLKPLHPHPILASRYPVLKPLGLPSYSGNLVEPTPSQCTGLPPVASHQLRAVGVPAFTHPPNGSPFPLHRTICPFLPRVVPCALQRLQGSWAGRCPGSGGAGAAGWQNGGHVALAACRAAGDAEGPLLVGSLRGSHALTCSSGAHEVGSAEHRAGVGCAASPHREHQQSEGELLSALPTALARASAICIYVFAVRKCGDVHRCACWPWHRGCAWQTPVLPGRRAT